MSIDALQQLVPPNASRLNEPMNRHTSFKIGGPADIFVRPHTPQQLVEVWQHCQNTNLPVTLLGDGTNTLVADAGIRGVVLCTAGLNAITLEPPAPAVRITAGAGARLRAVADAALQAGLAGMAFASGIPGTVGGAIYMNAGAYGHDISHVCETVTVFQAGHLQTIPAAHMNFGYRASRTAREGGLILEATFALQPGHPATIKADYDDLNTRRRDKQPLDFPSAGSTFKRPNQPNTYASQMIDEAGLKGLSVGGAQVSPKHAGFIINTGHATAQDVLTLMHQVRQQVHAKFGLWLEPEVQIIGVKPPWEKE